MKLVYLFEFYQNFKGLIEDVPENEPVLLNLFGLGGRFDDFSYVDHLHLNVVLVKGIVDLLVEEWSAPYG